MLGFGKNKFVVLGSKARTECWTKQLGFNMERSIVAIGIYRNAPFSTPKSWLQLSKNEKALNLNWSMKAIYKFLQNFL